MLLAAGLGFGAYTFLSGDDKAAGEGEQVITEESVEADKDAKDGDAKEGEAKEGESKDEKPGDEKTGEKGKEDEIPKYDSKKEVGFGETYKFEPFSLNLANLENHYIRVSISIEYSGGDKQKNELNARIPQLRDAIINIIGSKTKEFLLAPDGKDALRKEILIRMNRYMKTKIDAVYITDIIIE